MPIDPNVFDKIKTFGDYQKADQDFQIRKALAQQQIQTGGIDAATKANIYKTQVVSAATASGNQGDYDRARQTLQSQGIDISDLAPDVQTASQQAQAGRLAQSPLGSLLNAGLKGEANNIAATAAMGSVGAGQQLDPLSQSLMGNLGLKAIAPQPGTVPARSPSPPIIQPQVQAGTPAGTQAMSDMYDAPAQSVTLSQSPVQAASAAPRFVPPQQQPGETNQAYNQRVQTSFEAYKADPSYIESAATATNMGKDKADAAKAAVGASANYDQVVQTIDGIKALNNSPAGLPQNRGFVPASAQAALAQNLGDTSIGNALGVAPQAQADNSNAFTKLNEAQTIGAIKELASTGQIRMTRTLENILNRGYLIEPGASPTSKDQQANIILAELNNSKIAAQNVNAGLNGDQAAPYQAMPVAQQPSPPKIGTVMHGTDGDYLYNGGDPAVQTSWKKVK